MEREMRVRPGTPDDDNRDIFQKNQNSDIVVNETE